MNKIIKTILPLIMFSLASANASDYKISINKVNYDGSITVSELEPSAPIEEKDISGVSLNTYRAYYTDYSVRSQNIVNLTYDTTLVYAYTGSVNTTFSIDSNNVFTFNISSTYHGAGVFNGYVFEGIPDLVSVSDVQYVGSNIPVYVNDGILYFNLQNINPNTTTMTMQLNFN